MPVPTYFVNKEYGKTVAPNRCLPVLTAFYVVDAGVMPHADDVLGIFASKSRQRVGPTVSLVTDIFIPGVYILFLSHANSRFFILDS